MPAWEKLWIVVDLVLLAAGLSLVVVVGPGIFGDAVERYAALAELITQHRLSPTKSSLVGPLLATPLWWLGGQLHAREKTIAHFNLVVLVIAGAVLFSALRRALGSNASRRFLIVVLFGSGYLHEAMNFNNEVFSSLAVACGLLGLSQLSRASAVWPGLAIVLGTVNMASNAVGATLGILRMLLHEKRLRYLVIVVGCVVGLTLEALIRRHSPFATGYEGNHGTRTQLPFSGLPGFSYPFVLGVLSIVFSFGKGLVFFYPGLFAPVQRFIDDPDLKAVRQAWLLAVVGLVVVYSRWWAWYGGMCWGPRFFLFAALPSALAFTLWTAHARSALSALAAALLLAYAFWVGYDGLVFEIQNLDICSAHSNRLEAFCWYVPEFSPLVRPFIVARTLATWQRWAIAIFCSAYLRASAPAWRKTFVLGRAACASGLKSFRLRAREMRF